MNTKPWAKSDAMKDDELLREVRRGVLLIVGEFRGARAERTGYTDHKSGEVIQYIRAIHLIESACRGNLDRAVVYQRLPEIFETREEVPFPYVKGRLYVYFLVSCKWGKRTGDLLHGR